MKYIISFSLCILSTFALLGQGNSCNCNYYKINSEYSNEKVTAFAVKDILISLPRSFDFSTWSKGDVVLADNRTIDNKILFYDQTRDELYLYKGSPDQLYEVDKTTINGFHIESKAGAKKSYFKKKTIKFWYRLDSTESYLQVLTQGKVSLYIHKKIEVNSIKTTFNPIYSYFIELPNGKLIEVAPKRNQLLKLLSFKSEELKVLLKKEHNRLNDETQFAHAIELYNTLIQ